MTWLMKLQEAQDQWKSTLNQTVFRVNFKIQLKILSVLLIISGTTWWRTKEISQPIPVIQLLCPLEPENINLNDQSSQSL